MKNYAKQLGITEKRVIEIYQELDKLSGWFYDDCYFDIKNLSDRIIKKLGLIKETEKQLIRLVSGFVIKQIKDNKALLTKSNKN